MKSLRWSRWGLLSMCCAASSFAADGADPAELFGQLDANKDGQVTLEEVPEDARPHFERLIRKGDKDENKSLSQEEWVAAHVPDVDPEAGPGPGGPGGREGRPNPGQMFERMDANKDGKLSKSEIPEGAPQPIRDMLTKAFEKAGKEELTREDLMKSMAGAKGGGGGEAGKMLQKLKKLDKNGDGKVSADEFPAEGAERLKAMLERMGGGDSIDLKKAEEFAANKDGIRTRSEGQPGKPDGKPRPKAKPGEGDEPDARRSENDDRPEGGPRPDGERRGPDGDRGPEGHPPRGDFGQDGDRPHPEGHMDDHGPHGRDGQHGPHGRPPHAGILHLLDENHDGRISRDEFSKAATYFGDLDQNRDGSLDLDELMGMPMHGPAGDHEMRREGRDRREEGDRPEGGPGGRFNPEDFWKQLDKDGDGSISKEEAPERMKARFDDLDANKDGELDREELHKMMERRGGGPGRGEGPRPERPDSEEVKPEGDKPSDEKPAEDKPAEGLAD